VVDAFKKVKRIEHESLDQVSIEYPTDEVTPISNKFDEVKPTETKAGIIVDEYGRTIEFQKFLEQLLRDNTKLKIEIDPEDDPEVWMAMNRVFSNPAPKINQDSYYQVIDALEAMERIEGAEESPRADVEDDILSNLPYAQEVDEDEIKEEDFQISAVDEIEEKSRVKRESVFVDPPPPDPPPPPPKPRPWLRRWRRGFRKINVLGREYKVQWLPNRWWRRRNR